MNVFSSHMSILTVGEPHFLFWDISLPHRHVQVTSFLPVLCKISQAQADCMYTVCEQQCSSYPIDAQWTGPF